MQPSRKRHGALGIAGITVRTTNNNEASPGTARIPALWGQFFNQDLVQNTPHRNAAESGYFGVYSRYASDAKGAFDLTAGVAVDQGATVQIEAGEYLTFVGVGAMPQAVVQAWQRVWQYFDEHPQIQRRYRSDFEAYDGKGQVVVYVGVEPDA